MTRLALGLVFISMLVQAAGLVIARPDPSVDTCEVVTTVSWPTPNTNYRPMFLVPEGA